MNNEILESKIAELVNAPEGESALAFSIFKEKVTKLLTIGEALQIENLGVFQLKEQLSHSDGTKSIDPNAKNLTLLFSPDTGHDTQDYLFLNIELDNKEKDESEFDENVFQLGVGKQLATIESSDSVSSENSNRQSLESNISVLLEKAEMMKDYDLWEDYLKTKETTDILSNNDLKEDDEMKSRSDEKVDLTNMENLLDEDFVPMAEDEILEDYIEGTDFIHDDAINNLTEEINIDENTQEKLIDEDLEEDDEDVILESEKTLENADNIIDQIDENIEQDVELGNLIEDDQEANFEENAGDIIDHQESSLKIQVELPSDGDKPDEKIDSEDLPKDNSEQNEKQDIPGISSEIPKFRDDVEVQYRYGNRRKSPIIYFLIAAFIVVGSIGIYYLFFQNPTWLYDQHEVEVTLSQQHAKSTDEKENQSDIIDDTKLKTSPDNIDSESLTPSENIVTEKLNMESQEVPDKKNNNEIKEKAAEPSKSSITKNDDIEEKEVAKNIYHDGFVYNIQVSSWQQRVIAEREVGKLMKRGLPAFLIKAFIPKFNSTWHRVRIGPYNSLKEAKEAQKQLNK